MKKTKEEQALENLKILQEVDLISRREFLSVASLLGSATVVANLMTPQNALAWVATRMRKGRASSDPYAAIDVGDIGHSLRFRSGASATFSKSMGTPTDPSKWSMSCWFKRGNLSSDYSMLFGKTINATANFDIRFNVTTDTIEWVFANALRLTAAAVFRDPSAWSHLLIVWDVGNATAALRARMYLNGVELTTFTTDQRASISSANNAWNTAGGTYPCYIGSSNGGGGFYDGYMSRIAFVDGQALTPSSFGYLNPNSNSWVTNSQSAVKAIVDAGGTNSFMLDFDDGTSAATLGYDKSTKANNWTATGISLTAGTTYDWMLDTPSNNYCVLNPLQTGSYSNLSNGNLKSLGNTATNSGVSVGTLGVTSGKWYWEIVNPILRSETIGVATKIVDDHAKLINGESTFPPAYGIGARHNGGTFGIAGELQAVSAFSWNDTDIIGIAVDADNGAVFFAKNGTWLNSGDPLSGSSKTGAFGKYTPSSSRVVTPFCGSFNTGYVEVNFGQRPFTYTPPTGFKSLSTANLPKPTITNSKKHFDIVTRTGTGAIYTKTGLSFKPDLLWSKCRNNTRHLSLQDSVRGANKQMLSDSTEVEYDATTIQLQSFNFDGYTIGTGSTGAAGAYLNALNDTYVDWLWKGGGSAVSNNTGSINSQVSANTAAGFSIVTYAGNGTSGATVGHGLGTAPKMIFIKSRGPTARSWGVYHASVGNTGALYLDQNCAVNTAAFHWNNTSPTSNVFSLGNGTVANSAENCVAYCFADIAGYSKFGSYIGNGSIDGPFVWCGFKTRWILIKEASVTATNWFVWDTMRDTYNVLGKNVFVNLVNVEGSGNSQLDITSGGFKLRHDNANFSLNANGVTYIFAAFAEAPFKYANAR